MLKNTENRKVIFVLILVLVAIISIGSVTFIILASSLFETFADSAKQPCTVLPDIEIVREVVEEHHDIIESIENISPGNTWVEINERCDGKGDLLIYYDTIYTKKEIKSIIGGDTFFGVPYRMFNI
jgi:hypothetical protein